MGEESGESSNALSQTSEEDTLTDTESKPLSVDTDNNINENEIEPLNRPRKGSIHSHIDEKIGCRIEEYRCQHNNFTGILYVGPLGLVFLGRFLLFEWTVVLKWSEVTKVKRKTATPTAFSSHKTVVIRIETSSTDPSKPEPGVYDFEGFFDPRTTLEQLLKLHNDSLLDNDENNLEQIMTKRGSAIPLRRSSSNPAEKISNIFNFDDDLVESPIVTQQKMELEHSDPNKTTILDLRNQYSSTNKAALQKIANAAASSQAQTMQKDSTRVAKPEASQEQLLEEWNKVCSEIQNYPEAPVRDKTLVLEDLDAFVDTFVGDSAQYSWSEYMTQIVGDLDVVATPWEACQTDDASEALTRTIHYTHPINAPMTPPKCPAQKEQTLKRYGNQNGLVVETKTIVNDVPMTDCFYVKDIIQVASTPIANQFKLNIRFEIVFVKSTMFRALISRTTASEFNKFMTDLASWFDKYSGGSKDSPVEPSSKPLETLQAIPTKPLQQVVPTTNDTSESGNFEFGWKLLVICLLMWMAQKQQQIFHEQQALREDLREFQSTLHLADTKLLRDEWTEWKSLLAELEQKRTTDAQSLRKDVLEWKATLLKHEPSRKTKAQ